MTEGKQLIFKYKQKQKNEIDGGPTSLVAHFKPVNKDIQKQLLSRYK